MLPRNVVIRLTSDASSCHRGTESWDTPLRKPRNWRTCSLFSSRWTSRKPSSGCPFRLWIWISTKDMLVQSRSWQSLTLSHLTLTLIHFLTHSSSLALSPSNLSDERRGCGWFSFMWSPVQKFSHLPTTVTEDFLCSFSHFGQENTLLDFTYSPHLIVPPAAVLCFRYRLLVNRTLFCCRGSAINSGS